MYAEHFSEPATSHVASAPIEHQFYPYASNGGTILAIAGADYALLAGDTRHITGYSINTRFRPSIHTLENLGGPERAIVVAANGFSADGDALVRRLAQRAEWYTYNHNKPLSVSACARLVQTMLYGKRTFPYYVHTIVAGLDESGRGEVYSFDPVGSYEREQCRAGGSAASLLMPFLDNQVNKKNQYDAATGLPQVATDLPLEETLKLVKDAFSSVTERHIHVGDYLEIKIVTKEGVKVEYFPLKRD
ncbi:beta 6 subunit of the 20S proteasome [Myxozyma melibiosi]|uniref:Beta 6 subunit of the 20S proteasome n=1 Tax=Myxozyma melibiosi TaxID=54550 RepID=A0ABR1EZ71_9ASCO